MKFVGFICCFLFILLLTLDYVYSDDANSLVRSENHVFDGTSVGRVLAGDVAIAIRLWTEDSTTLFSKASGEFDCIWIDADSNGVLDYLVVRKSSKPIKAFKIYEDGFVEDDSEVAQDLMKALPFLESD